MPPRHADAARSTADDGRVGGLQTPDRKHHWRAGAIWRIPTAPSTRQWSLPWRRPVYRAAFTTRPSAALRPDQALVLPRIEYVVGESAATVAGRVRAARRTRRGTFLAVRHGRLATSGDENGAWSGRLGRGRAGAKWPTFPGAESPSKQLGLGAPRHRWMLRRGGRQHADQILIS